MYNVSENCKSDCCGDMDLHELCEICEESVIDEYEYERECQREEYEEWCREEEYCNAEVNWG